MGRYFLNTTLYGHILFVLATLFCKATEWSVLDRPLSSRNLSKTLVDAYNNDLKFSINRRRSASGIRKLLFSNRNACKLKLAPTTWLPLTESNLVRSVHAVFSGQSKTEEVAEVHPSSFPSIPCRHSCPLPVRKLRQFPIYTFLAKCLEAMSYMSYVCSFIGADYMVLGCGAVMW